jgi:hypothetical protein
MRPQYIATLFVICVSATIASAAFGYTPWATSYFDYLPAPGQYVQDPQDPEEPFFNIPEAALGRPYAGGFMDPDTSSLVTLGGFGGTITLGFDHTVLDEPTNPFGMDFIVFGNAFYASGNPNRHWAECGHVEVSRDANGNGLPDDPWYIIPGSHIAVPGTQYTLQTWDDDLADPTYPPFPPVADETWIPYGRQGEWTSEGFLLPEVPFNVTILVNPNGEDATEEGIYGYADYMPVLKLGDIDADGQAEEPGMPPEHFYLLPDDPFTVGISAGSGGGDAFDIAWAIDPETGAPAELDGIDFVRITTAVDYVAGPFGEISTEIDAVADVAGDYDMDGDHDLADAAGLQRCFDEPAPPLDPCGRLDHNGDEWVDLNDVLGFVNGLTGPQ